MRVGKVTLAVALAASLVGNVVVYWRLSKARAEVPYFSSERPYVDKAIRLFASEGGRMTNRFPIAVAVPDPQHPDELLTCVSLKLHRGMLGWTPVYCFDRQGAVRSHFRV
jgi:hypothetical protein